MSVWLTLLALLGLLISIYISYSQKTGTKMSCIIGKNCTLVTTSPYAKTFGISNSDMGIFYYLILIIFSVFGFPIPYIFLLAISAVASLFSLYLIYLQFFVIRELCDYCVLSAFVNWGILALFLTHIL